MIRLPNSIFTRTSSPQGALFHYFPFSIYEYREHIWRVTELHGGTARELMEGNAVKNLLRKLLDKGVDVQMFITPTIGESEVFPEAWVCSSCGYYIVEELRRRECPRCRSEMQQYPFIITCDEWTEQKEPTGQIRRLEPCGYIAPPRKPKSCRCGSNEIGVVIYDRNDLHTMHLVCKRCQNSVLPSNMCDRRCMACMLPNPKPCSNNRYAKQIEIFSDVEPASFCPSCMQPTKRLTPATSNIVSPVYILAFEDDTPAIVRKAEFRVKEDLEDKGVPFNHIEKVFGLSNVVLAKITLISCVYGYRIGNANPIPFPDGKAYAIAENVSAAIFLFDAARLSADLEEREKILHAASHAFLQTAGYITGLGIGAYRESVDAVNCAAMVFSVEAGGCEVLVREPSKLLTWLRRARALVHECKNDCNDGCGFCVFIPNWQCQMFNHNLNRRELKELWSERFLFGGEMV